MKKTFFISALLCGIAFNTQVVAANFALTHVELVDVESLTLKSDQTILITDDVITGIYKSTKALPDGYVAIDLRGKYLLPGFIDSHTHHATEPEGYDNENITRQRLKKLLWGGVTSIRDMGGDVRVLANLKRSAQLDLIVSPDIYYAVILGGASFFSDPRTIASALGEKPGSTDWMRTVSADTDFTALMQRTKGTGASGIKIYADVPSVVVEKLATAAKQVGLKVWSHAYIGPDKPSTVVNAGVEVISHVPDLSAEVITNYKSWRRKDASLDEKVRVASFDPQNYVGLFQSMKQNGTILDATITVFDELRSDNAKRELMYQYSVFLAKLAHQQGIKISAGTDSIDDNAVLPLLHHELVLLVELGGLTPAEAIQAATLNSAEALGIADKVGTIKVGKKANLLVLNSDPLADIRHSADIAHVIKNGRFIYRGDDARLPFTSARVASGMLWMSGQIGNFPGTMTLAGTDISTQMTQAMQNISAVLQQHNLTRENIAKCTLMLADIRDWAIASDIYKTYFSAPLPARSAFAASGLALNAKVEIECVASLL